MEPFLRLRHGQQHLSRVVEDDCPRLRQKFPKLCVRNLLRALAGSNEKKEKSAGRLFCQNRQVW
jgi:hypothetical protein